MTYLYNHVKRYVAQNMCICVKLIQVQYLNVFELFDQTIHVQTGHMQNFRSEQHYLIKLDLCERERERENNLFALIISPMALNLVFHCSLYRIVSTRLFTHANCNIKNRIHDLPLSLSGQQYDMNALRVQGCWQEDFANWKGPITMVFQSISFTIFQKSSKTRHSTTIISIV